jgi:molybdopterin converting factor small subunit
MPVVTLRSPLRQLAGDKGTVDVDGITVEEVLTRLEASYPRLCGWVRDERGHIREHVNIFLNGERAGLDARVSQRDRIQILPAISGGADAEVLVGTRKGLFVLRGQRGGPMEVAFRRFDGIDVEFAMKDPRTGTYYASVTHGQFGPHLYFTNDPESERWEEASFAFPENADASVSRIWVIQPGDEDGVLWAGIDPAALFKSEDGGKTWLLNKGLWDDPSRPKWQPGFGGLALHSIATWPGDPARMAIGISAAGVWITEDGGESWHRGNKGIVARYLPEEAREGAVDLCVHNMHRSPVEPETLYLQFHWGVYRSDDAGESWNDIGSDGKLPSDFGFPLVADPRDAKRAFVIPLTADSDRVTPDEKVRVFETSDRGESWRALGEGLPQDSAYLTILRQAFGHDGGDPLGLYFGATSGEVFGSADGGETWATVAEHLPPVLSVRPSA